MTTITTLVKPTFSASDIDLETATNAHGGTSHTPERRGKQEQAFYVADMTKVFEAFDSITPDEKKAALYAEIEEFKTRYISKKKEVLCARARCLSTNITGASNFNVSRNEKAYRSHRNKSTKFSEWFSKAQKGITRRLELSTSSIISADDTDAVAKIQAKITKLETFHNDMKLGNKEYKRTKGNIEAMNVPDYIKKACATWETLDKGFRGNRPFASYSLTNNNANIKRYKDRLIVLQREQETPDTEITFDGGKLIDNAEDNRIQFLFDDKPNDELRAKLKKAAFRWAPSKGVWQRQRTDNARYAAKQLLGLL